jgi:hypothetical protein
VGPRRWPWSGYQPREEHKRARSLLEGKYPQYRHVAIPGAVIDVAVERWHGWP